MRHLLGRCLFLACCISPTLGGCAALADSTPTYYRVKLNSVGMDRFQDIYSGYIFKTIVCIRISILEEAILEHRLFASKLHFKDGKTCSVAPF